MRQAAHLLDATHDAVETLRRSIATTVIGQTRVVNLMLVALFARGHALLVGMPGLAKTLLVSSLAKALSMRFSRIQFTPDLLPADITGTDVLDEQLSASGRVVRQLRFLPGPVFAQVLLADEINRTPPKTQAALLEAMQERTITVGTQTYPLPDPFHVFATRNPIEHEGTYPLPEAQIDRFLLEIQVDYPTEAQERDIARQLTAQAPSTIAPALDAAQMRAVTGLVPQIPVTETALHRAVAITRATRPAQSKAPEIVKNYVRYGAGPRGSQALVLCAKAWAAIQGKPVAEWEDIEAMLLPALGHRLVLNYRAEADGVAAKDILEELARGQR